ncbi:Beta-ketoadipate enol-lactone hydrolase I (fragment) [Capnocytophaga canimorsus]|uniref:Beta-ketoadipate enol-lactone hydrolase I n=1 Tax=Capnocytophaga canimorsus TaxID=28188 RepID=A0A0B7IAS2_9FLAO
MKSDRHTSFFYTKKGKGKAVILLHGFLENHTIWEKFAEELSATHRVITPDLAGHGKTPCFSEIHPMEMMAEGIFEILQAEKIKDCILVGHSMGGYVSLAFAEKYPDQVKGIVLMNSTAAADSIEKQKNREKPYELPRQIKPIYQSCHTQPIQCQK